MLDLDLYHYTFAQAGATDLPTGSPVETDGAGAGGAGTAAPGAGPSGSPFGGSNFFFILIGMMVLLLVISTVGPRRERKKREALIAAIKKHDRVQTIGGVIGSIVEVKPDFVVLKVDESSNTRIRFAKTAIQQVLDTTADEPAMADGEV